MRLLLVETSCPRHGGLGCPTEPNTVMFACYYTRHGGAQKDAGKSWQLMEIQRHDRWSMRARFRRWLNRRRIRRHVKRHMYCLYMAGAHNTVTRGSRLGNVGVLFRWWRTMRASQNPMDAPPPDKVMMGGMVGGRGGGSRYQSRAGISCSWIRTSRLWILGVL